MICIADIEEELGLLAWLCLACPGAACANSSAGVKNWIRMLAK